MINNELIKLYLNTKQFLINELSNLIYGSIEIRERNSSSYIYVHYSDDGIRRTKFVGEYNKDLINVIRNNNLLADDIKALIRDYNKKLKKLNYRDISIPSLVKRNIDFARINLTKSIYNQAVIEGISTTLPQTENIIEGLKVSDMTATDIIKVVNLKHAWEFILNENIVLEDNNFSILCEINKLIGEGIYYTSGRLRDVPVSISGSNYVPPIPFEVDILKELDNIKNGDMSDIDKAIEYILYIVKRQMFIDGNKRTSLLFANHYLVSKGVGLIIIDSQYSDEYKKLLVHYYENNDKKDIIKFIKDKCFIKL